MTSLPNSPKSLNRNNIKGLKNRRLNSTHNTEMTFEIKIQNMPLFRWWGTVNRMTGRSEKASSYSLECYGKVLNEMELADTSTFGCHHTTSFLTGQKPVFQLSNLMKFARSSWQFTLSKPRDLRTCPVVS